MPTQKTRREKRERETENARVWERETSGTLAPFFICFFLPLGVPYLNWASQECCLFYVRSSIQSSDLLLFYFCRLFPSFFLDTAILGSFFLF